MDALTPEYITRIAHEVDPTFTLGPTTVAYLQYLVMPFAQAMEQVAQVESVDSLYAWLGATFHGELARQAPRMMLSTYTKTEGDRSERLKAACKDVTAYLLAVILESGVKVSRKTWDTTILPWDIKKAIAKDKELEPTFKQNDGTDKLPATVRVGASDFQHTVSEDFVAGLLLYYTSAGQEITIFLFGVPLTTAYLTNEDGSRHDEDVVQKGRTPAKFLVQIGDKTVAFWTPDFLQGAATAAQWLNEDYHTRVTNLRMVNEDGTMVPLTF